MTLAGKLRARQPVLGMQNFSGSAHMIEVLAVAGFDFVMIDTEHTAWGIEHAVNLVRAADSFDIAPVVRVFSPVEPQIAKALDCGAAGVMVPLVSTAEDADCAVKAAWYPPRGRRGMCPDTRGAQYGMESWVSYARRLPEDIAVIPLIETIEGVDNIEAILTVDGIDSVCFGPGDYGAALGAAVSGFTDEIADKTMSALDKVAAATQASGASLITTPLSGLDDPGREINDLRDRGVNGVMYSIDTMVFHAAARRIVEAYAGAKPK